MSPELKIFWIGLGMVLSTIIGLFVIYVHWNLIAVNLSLAAETFDRWPWFSGSCAVTTITCLFAFFAYWNAQGDYSRYRSNIAGYTTVGIWIPILFFHPGAEALGIGSDTSASYLLIVVIQGVGLHFVSKIVWRERNTTERD